MPCLLSVGRTDSRYADLRRAVARESPIGAPTQTRARLNRPAARCAPAAASAIPRHRAGGRPPRQQLARPRSATGREIDRKAQRRIERHRRRRPRSSPRTHSPTNTDTASPFATGSMRRSHGALSVSSVCSSSNPAALTTARSQALNDPARRLARQQDAFGGEGADRESRPRSRIRATPEARPAAARLAARRCERRSDAPPPASPSPPPPPARGRQPAAATPASRPRRAEARSPALRSATSSAIRVACDAAERRVAEPRTSPRPAAPHDARRRSPHRPRPAPAAHVRAEPSPAGVSSTRRVVRTNSTSPSSRSSSRIARESGDCDMCRRSAARPKCSSSATATKYRSCRSSTGTSTRCRPRSVLPAGA